MAKKTAEDLTRRIKELIPKVKEGEMRVGFPNVELYQGNQNFLVPIKENTSAVSHISGSNA